jgi:hypothetical protein
VDSTPDSSEYQGNQGGLSFNPGALAVSTTYYWRIDSVNGYGTTTGAVWSFTTGAGSPPPGGPLLVDGFESGGANWFVTAGTPAISTAAKYTGSYGARIPKTSGMVTYINATGRTNISLKYARRTSGLDSSENLYVEWSAAHSITAEDGNDDPGLCDGHRGHCHRGVRTGMAPRGFRLSSLPHLHQLGHGWGPGRISSGVHPVS